MTREECKNIIKRLIKDKPSSFCNLIKVSKQFKDIHDFIFNETPMLISDEYKWSTRIYWFMNDLKEFPVCAHPNCKNTLEHHNVISALKGFTDFCCQNCANTSPQHYEHIKNTVNKLYGVDNVFQTDWVNDKRRETMVSKYGAEFTQQIPELIQKCQKTCIEHFGVKHQWMSNEIKNKNKATIIDKYGTDNVFELECIREKQRISLRTKHYNDFLKCENVKPNFSLDDYLNCKDPVHTVFEWICLENGHNHIFKSCVDSNNFTRFGEYARCWDCHPNISSGVSKEEKDVVSFVKSITNKKVLHQTKDNRQIIPNREIDIIVPELKIGIEFDGMYFHSYGKNDNNEEVFKDRHAFKTDFCDNIGWRLIHIFEDEWIYKNDIVKSRLCSILGSIDKRIYARKCIVKEISTKIANDFLNINHIQGKCNASIKIGLFFEDELVSVMTFGKPRFNKKFDYELLRFASKLNYRIDGAAGKLLKYFERIYHPKNLISYADRRWSNGGVYKALGFSLEGNSEPNYYYLKGDIRYHRMAFQKYKLKDILKKYDENCTEKKNMLENGYRIIYDCGNSVFVKYYNY